MTVKNPLPLWYKPILSKEERDSPMLLCRKPELPKHFSRKRIKELATPKKDHLDTMSKPPNKIRWGNQEPLWKVKISSNDPNERISNLAQPKKNFKKLQPLPQFEFSCGRSSPIRATKKLEPATDRLIELARSKNNNLKIGVSDKYQFSCGRSSPIWKVSSAAQYAISSDRIENLAKPKVYHKNFLPDRPIKTVFNKSAGQSTAAPNERLEALARAKDHSNNHYFIDARRPEESIIKVKKGALLFEASDRLKELSAPVGFSNDFEHPNLDFWKVKRGALKAQASDRFNELAKHVTRQSMDSVQYDQNAFTVSVAAKKARCSDRLASLAHPIQR